MQYFNPVTGIGVVSLPRPAARMVWAALTTLHLRFMNSVYFRVLHVSGTLKQCHKEAIKYDANILLTEVAEEVGWEEELIEDKDAMEEDQ